eukprot:7283898-Pyramimonas_sp.AAC.1
MALRLLPDTLSHGLRHARRGARRGRFHLHARRGARQRCRRRACHVPGRSRTSRRSTPGHPAPS